MNLKEIIRSRAMLTLGSISLVVIAASLASGLAQTSKAPSAFSVAPRFQVSAWGFGSPSAYGHGCYILDTVTGELWVGSDAGVKKVSEPLRCAEPDSANKITGANAGGQPRWPIPALWAARIAQFCR